MSFFLSNLANATYKKPHKKTGKPDSRWENWHGYFLYYEKVAEEKQDVFAACGAIACPKCDSTPEHDVYMLQGLQGKKGLSQDV
eukprot:1155861-Pelagomonas_calceolata.AAC.5